MAPLAVARLIASGGLFAALLVAATDAYQPAARGPAVAAHRLEDPVVRGRAVFQAKGCVACHTLASVPGNAQVGPSLTALPHVAGTRRPGMSSEEYVRESLVSPQAFVVPGYSGSGSNTGSPPMPRLALSPTEVDALVAFLLSTHDPATATR